MKANFVRTAVATAMAIPSLAFFSNAASAGRADFVVRNMSDVPMVRLQVSSSNRSDWGRDLLRSSTVDPGESVTVRVNEPGCIHDIRATFATGQVLEEGGVNLCEVDSYTFR
jgi:hypothetical protein